MRLVELYHDHDKKMKKATFCSFKKRIRIAISFLLIWLSLSMTMRMRRQKKRTLRRVAEKIRMRRFRSMGRLRETLLSSWETRDPSPPSSTWATALFRLFCFTNQSQNSERFMNSLTYQKRLGKYRSLVKAVLYKVLRINFRLF